MIPVDATPTQCDWWTERDSGVQVPTIIGGPAEGPDVIPCPALVCFGDAATVIHVAYQLDEIEVAALAHGATLWLTTWGGLPIHKLEVETSCPPIAWPWASTR